MNNKLNFDLSFLNKYDEHISENITNNTNIESELSFTKIKCNNKSDNINWINLIIFSGIIIAILLASLIIISNNKRNVEILEIKNNAYEYLKNGNVKDYNNALNELNQYNIDINNVKNELLQKYNYEKDLIISYIAYNYKHNKEQYQLLKQKYLPQLFDNDENKFNQAIDEKLGYPELTLTKSPLPKSGIMKNYTGKKCIAPFRIESKNDEHTYMKLYDSISKKLALTIFIRAGETVQLDVPLGSYILKSASGAMWYNEKNCFGHNTNYTKEDTIFNFKIVNNSVEGYTLSLIKVANGNLRSIDIAPEDF